MHHQAQDFVVVACDINDLRSRQLFVKKLFKNIRACIRPVPSAGQFPPVQNIADKVEFPGVHGFYK